MPKLAIKRASRKREFTPSPLKNRVSSLADNGNPIHSKSQNVKGEISRFAQLETYFDQVWVINSKRRPDRLARFWSEIGKGHWPFRRPQIFNAIEGDKVGVPKFWQTGGGSYGCLRSHLVLLERAIQDDVTTGHFERH